VDSDYEARIEALLVEQRRVFVKPLRYTEGDESLPDFELHDVGDAPYVMEVFGRNDLPYAARARDKSARNDARYGADGWWRWRAYTEAEPPEFPSARPRHA